MSFIQLYKCPFCPNRDNKEWKSLLVHLDQRFYIIKVLLEPTVLVRNSWHQSCKMASKPAREPPRWKQSAASTVNIKWLMFALHTHTQFLRSLASGRPADVDRNHTAGFINAGLRGWWRITWIWMKTKTSSLFIFMRHAHNNEDFDCVFLTPGWIYTISLKAHRNDQSENKPRGQKKWRLSGAVSSIILECESSLVWGNQDSVTRSPSCPFLL